MVSGNSRSQAVLPPAPWMMAPWWPRPRPVRSASWRWEIHQLVMGKSWENDGKIMENHSIFPAINLVILKMEVYSWKNQRKSSFGGCSATFEYRRVYGMGHIMASNQKGHMVLGDKQLRELNPQKTNRLKLPNRNGDWATKIWGKTTEFS